MRTALLVALLAAAPLAQAAPRAKSRPSPPAKVMIDASYRLPVPPGWSGERDGSVTSLRGPADANGLATLLLVRYVPPGDREFPSLAAYLERQASPGLFSLPDEKTGPARDVRVAGRESKRIERRRSEVVAPDSFDAKKVPVREVHVLVPAAKGFYALLLITPETLYRRTSRDLETVLAGFQPKP